MHAGAEDGFRYMIVFVRCQWILHSSRSHSAHYTTSLASVDRDKLVDRAPILRSLHAIKRRLLEIVCLNFSLEGVNLVPTMRKPFDMLTKGLHLENNRGDCPNFEPPHGIVEPFVATFLLPPPPYLVRAGQIVRKPA